MNNNIEEYFNNLYKFIRDKESDNFVTYCKMPEHKAINAYIGIYEDYKTKIVYLSSWNTIVCGYMFLGNSVMTFCTWVHSRSTINHIGLFTKYACISCEDYSLMKEIAQNDRLRFLPLGYGTEEDNLRFYKKTVEELKENTFRKKPVFKTDNYFNWINC